MTIRDHNVTPPAQYTSKPGKDHIYIEAQKRGFPLSALPDGWYEAGPDDPVPEGQRPTGVYTYELRTVDDVTRSHRVPVCEEMPLEEVKANRRAAIVAECESRFDARWPATDRVLSTGGVPLDPASPEALKDAEEHQDARDAALILVDAATDAAGVAAVKVGWPDEND